MFGEFYTKRKEGELQIITEKETQNLSAFNIRLQLQVEKTFIDSLSTEMGLRLNFSVRCRAV